MKLGISKCFFSNCRYDGSIVNSDIINIISEKAEHISICPEVEIGLSVPRNTLRLIEEDGIKVIETKTGIDYTKDISDIYNKYKDLDGFILKNRSPSCALTDCKIYKDGRNINKGAGIFGNLVKENHKLFSEDEGRLTNKEIREFFLTKIYLFKRFNQSTDLKNFFLKEELLLNYINKNQTNELRKVLKEDNRDLFKKQLLIVIGRKPRKSNDIRTLKIVMNKLEVNENQRKYFDFLCSKFDNNYISKSEIKNYVYSSALFSNNKEILSSTYFNPFPKYLDVLLDSSK